jgi:hypothetical protein
MADEKFFSKPTAEETALLKRTGSADREVATAAARELAIAIQGPLRQGIMCGDITNGIFEQIVLQPGAAPEYPLDLLAPGTEKDYVAYTIPKIGRIPERNVEGDYVTVPTYEIGNSINWALRYARDARWDIVGRSLQVFRAGFVKKINDDAWHTLLAAALDRNIIVYDGDATAGQFTKRLVSLMKTVMRRNGGGNSTSANRGKLTDLYMSPESMEDIRDWKVDQVDEITRNQIFNAPDGSLSRIFGVTIHDIDELGEDQEYQNFYTNQLSGAVASGDLEIVVGLDLSKPNCFVMPIREDVQVFEDDGLHRSRQNGVYGWTERGVGVLSNTQCLLGSL